MLKRTMLVVSAGAFVLAGCGDDDPFGPQAGHPAALVGEWNEVGYDRGIVLQGDGTFQFVTLEGGNPGTVEGSGTWEATSAAIELAITQGHYQWLDDGTNTAPSRFTCQYSVSGTDLTLSIEILSVVYTVLYERIE